MAVTVTLHMATWLPSSEIALISTVPGSKALTLPDESTVAIFSLLLFQVTFLLVAFVGL